MPAHMASTEPDATRTGPAFELSLLVRTVLAVGGSVLVLFGATEIGVTLLEPAQGASVVTGVVLVMLGVAAAGIPIALAMRDIIRVRARENRAEE